MFVIYKICKGKKFRFILVLLMMLLNNFIILRQFLVKPGLVHYRDLTWPHLNDHWLSFGKIHVGSLFSARGIYISKINIPMFNPWTINKIHHHYWLVLSLASSYLLLAKIDKLINSRWTLTDVLVVAVLTMLVATQPQGLIIYLAILRWNSNIAKS
jgi:hypothetical protein